MNKLEIFNVNDLIKEIARAIHTKDESILEICEQKAEGWLQDEESKKAQKELIGAAYFAIDCIYELEETQ